MIYISKPYFDKKEQLAVLAVLKSGMIAKGPKVAEFEHEFAKVCGTTYAVATNNGTAALHAALYALDIKEGDEVITTPFTFVATANVIVMQQARPVFVDIDSNTFNIDLKKIEEKITSKTKAILVVNLYGQPANYTDICKIAKQYKLHVIEDAAQSIGATYKKGSELKKSGNLGDIGCFSLYATKNITCGEGGMVTTNNKKFYERVRSFTQHSQHPTKAYNYLDLGYNYRMTDLAAAIGLEQLKKLDRITKTRQQIAKRYTEAFKTIKGIKVPYVASGCTHVYHQYTLRITKDYKMSRDELLALLYKKGIACRVYYPKGLYKFKHLTYNSASLSSFKETEQATKEVLSIPVYQGLSSEDVTYILDALRTL